ncbi:MAG: hypothetical protein FJ297_13805 [Planctomycetes bacterium]|nr:hypothetical protein [Planctomycetota bacterium]
MPKIAGPVARYPARMSFAWYSGVIALGSLALLHPACRGSEAPPIRLIDALFTATSALCVTGLTTLDTETDFSPLGQAVILLLIQVGGIGIMTFSIFVTIVFGRRAGLRQRAVLSETLGARDRTDLQWVLRSVLVGTLLIEFSGAAVLFVRNGFTMPLADAAWHAVFHSVSAFCNAGFSLWGDNLTRYGGDLTVNATIGLLVVLGGLGFPVLLDLRSNAFGPWRSRWDRLSVHSKLMLIGTAALLALGTIATLGLEWSNPAFRELPPVGRVTAAVFHSISCRTAGFNTVDIGLMSNATLLISILLMMIGAGPCSTAGGFKVSTAMALVLRAWSTFRGRTRVNVFRRTIPSESIERAFATTLLFLSAALAALVAFLLVEQSNPAHREGERLFLDASFEVFSALGTVGLSTGITPRLTDAGKTVLILLMFIGRLGPITTMMALSRGERPLRIEYPSEEPLIG